MSQAGTVLKGGGGGSTGILTVTGNTGGAVGADASNNINLPGAVLYTVTGNPATNTLTINPRPNAFPITPYVVGPVGAAGYQTIQSGINAANAGGGGMVWIQPGTYTENLTLFSGIQLSGPSEQNVLIIGTHIPPSSGTLNINRLGFQSATNIFSSVAAGTTAIIMEDCLVNVTNGYTFNLPNWVSPGSVACFNIGPFGTNDGFFFNTGGAGFFVFSAGIGNGTLNSLTTSGLTLLAETDANCPFNFVTGAAVTLDSCQFTAGLTFSNNSTGALSSCRISSGSTAALTMSSSASVSLVNSTVNSSNNPAIAGSGAGTLTYEDLVFLNNASFAGTLTLATTSWQPYSRAIAASDGTKVGTAAFKSSQFAVDPNGFVTLNGTGAGQTITGDSGGALSPAAGNWNILGRSGSKTSGSVSTLTVKSPPYTDQGSSTIVTLNSGSSVTAAITLTLPASAGLADGDLFEFYCTTAGALVIQAVGAQKIRIGSLISSAAGTATSTNIGDSVSLRFRAADGFFYATSVIGTWLLA